ncbi:MAG: hypothetical protein HQL59_11070 [Magnetococcales bacterium]|nr:hypothetical protein [Magnetococcales bacterium]
MLSELHRRGLGLKTRTAEGVTHEAMDPKDVDIDFDDVVIEPNPLGTNHQQKRPPLTTSFTLDNRVLEVDGGGPEDLPLIHQSVVERIHGDSDYRPISLRRVKHRVMYNNGDVGNPAEGLETHLKESRLLAMPLPEGTRKKIIVQSHLKNNRSFVFVEKGKSYWFDVAQAQTWSDASITCGPGGWTLGAQQQGLGVARSAVIASMGPLRRNPAADWFEVVGVVGDDKGEKVRPLQHTSPNQPWTPQSSGELILYANDVDFLYGNNMGSITVEIVRS